MLVYARHHSTAQIRGTKMQHRTNRSQGRPRRIIRAISSGAAIIIAALLPAGCVHVKETPELLYSQIEETAPETTKTPQTPKPAEKEPATAGPDSGKSADAAEDSKEKFSEEDSQTAAETAAEAVEKPSAEEVQTAIYYAMPGMDCWGDSITEGFLGACQQEV